MKMTAQEARDISNEISTTDFENDAELSYILELIKKAALESKGRITVSEIKRSTTFYKLGVLGYKVLGFLSERESGIEISWK